MIDKSRVELLQQMPIFGAIREDILEFMLDRSRMISIRRGEFFFHENDPGTSLFVLQKGRVAVVKNWKGEQRALHFMGKGDCFGEMSIMDLSPRSASVVALEDCEAIEISSSCLYDISKKDLQQFALIHMNMGREVSRRLREADEQLFRLGLEGSKFDTKPYRLT
jgi:CRP/FNR family transcriptional regulator, cyclic AMP receptor protein